MKKMKVLLAAGIMSMMFASTVFGAGWVQAGAGGPGEVRWWYDLDGGQYYAGSAQGPQWQWIDGNGDGTAECYAFDESGWMYANTVTPDGYQVNGDGAWMENGQVQTREVEPGYGGTRVAQSQTNTDEPDDTEEDVLIAYFSRTGNTRQAASLIQAQTGGDTFEIQPAESYPSSYSATTERAEREIAAGTLPALAADVENFDEYEIIFVGYPIWWDTTPPVVNTFLNSHEFSGKTVVPFCTSGGSGIRGSLTNINQYCTGATILSGRDLSGANAQEVSQWLTQIGIIG